VADYDMLDNDISKKISLYMQKEIAKKLAIPYIVSTPIYNSIYERQ